MKNKIEDLRNHLFEVIEALKDNEKPMDIARAKAIAEVAGKIIDTAKTEVEFARVTGQSPAGNFMPQQEEPPQLRRLK